MRKDIFGDWEYKSNGEKATLKKDIFGKWNYNDSNGNKFEFSTNTWSSLQYKYGSEENIFHYLVNEFLY